MVGDDSANVSGQGNRSRADADVKSATMLLMVGLALAAFGGWTVLGTLRERELFDLILGLWSISAGWLLALLAGKSSA